MPVAGLHPYRSRLSTVGGALMSGLVQALSVLGLDHGDHGSGHEVMKSNGEHLMPSSMNLKKIVEQWRNGRDRRRGAR